MNRRILIVVSCAFVLSVCASYLVYRAVGTRVTPAKSVQAEKFIVAARDLASGAVIHESDMRMASWPGPIPKGAALRREGLLNRGVVSPIFEGEPVTENRLSPQGSGGGLSGTIPPGMRACAVRVNEVVGVAGFVVPGMRVDVLVAGLPPGGDPLEGSKVRTVLQNIQVLSAGTNFQKDQEGKPEPAQVVNLLVTPAQAETLSLASNETRIQLILRNPTDTQISRPPGAVMSDLFGDKRVLKPVVSVSLGGASASRILATPTIVPPAVPRLYTIEVSNGSVQTQAKFSLPPGKQ